MELRGMAVATKSKESTDATSHGGEWIMFTDNLTKRVSRMLANMDNSTIDGKLIKVYQPRFPRPRVEISNSQRSGQNSGFHRHVAWKPLVGKSKIASNVSGAASKDGSAKMSYWDALLSNIKVDTRVAEELDHSFFNIKVDGNGKNLATKSIPVGDNEWMKRCMVGVMKCSFELGFVQHVFTHDGIEAKITNWGVENDSFVIMFETVFGVPLACWHEDFFSNLGNCWGIFVCTNESTKNRDRLDMARMTVDISIEKVSVDSSIFDPGGVGENFADV
ncbi:hypothetical protein V6N13_083249 [Hibiscus sabdariffa]|uniref:DUF4283 domain-containing protein n=1 Tax=Hibiscus sabdariffa TaxID=183260 RepID=A0ABR2SY06_9ROSI